jgi:hypothetical protein
MTGNLMTLQFRIALNEDLLNEEFRKGAEDRELTDSPPLSMKIPGQNIIKESALVIQPTIVGDSAV